MIPLIITSIKKCTLENIIILSQMRKLRHHYVCKYAQGQLENSRAKKCA